MTNYWEKHYSSGGVSGHGDTEQSRYWKMQILFENGFDLNKSIIDVGCGDMIFWQDIPLTNYTGIDISGYQISQNRKNHPEYKFHIANSSQYIELPKADIVVCFDMLFHIMNEDEYVQTLLNLTNYSKKKIFVYTWGNNPFESFINKLVIRKPFQRKVITDGIYQYYRNYKKFSKIYIEGEFNLVNTFTDKRWKYGELYYYEKKES